MKENENKEPSKIAGAARQGGNTNTEIIGSAVSTAVGEPVATAGHLTDERIEQVAKEAHAAGLLSWLGFEKDGAGKYTVPVLSKYHYQFARAIEREVATRLAAPTQAKPVDLSGLTRYTVRTSSMGAPAWMEATYDGDYVELADVERLLSAPTQVSAPQASAAQEVQAVPVGYARQSELDKLADSRVAGVGMMIHKEPGDGKVALYLAPVSTSTAPAAMDEVRNAALEEAASVYMVGAVAAREIRKLKTSQPSLDEVTGAGKGEGDE